MRGTIALLFVLIGGMASTAWADAPTGILWLSDLAPKRARPVASQGHDSMDNVVSGEGDGSLSSGVKHLWLREGDDIGLASYVKSAPFAPEFELLGTDGTRTKVATVPMGGLAHAKIELPDMGFYNAYLRREALDGDTLRVRLAKIELLKGSCCQKNVDPARVRAISDPAQPLELVREHAPDEKLFTRLVSGDKVSFVVYRQGKPLAGVPVTLYTQQGWQKRVLSDAGGRAEFVLIRDYFPAWSDFRRYSKGTFVAVAETVANEPGIHEGHRYTRVAYQATLSGRYAPSPYDYKSYAWGLGIVLFVLAFGGLGIYLYRRRRVKPFQEVRFDEKA
jgi:hypothetical protein